MVAFGDPAAALVECFCPEPAIDIHRFSDLVPEQLKRCHEYECFRIHFDPAIRLPVGARIFLAREVFRQVLTY
jgi:hypothetical protein